MSGISFSTSPAVLAFERELRQECKARGAGIIIALTARNDEAQRFYQSVGGAHRHLDQHLM